MAKFDSYKAATQNGFQLLRSELRMIFVSRAGPPVTQVIVLGTGAKNVEYECCCCRRELLEGGLATTTKS
jgi:hypothetical protein